MRINTPLPRMSGPPATFVLNFLHGVSPFSKLVILSSGCADSFASCPPTHLITPMHLLAGGLRFWGSPKYRAHYVRGHLLTSAPSLTSWGSVQHAYTVYPTYTPQLLPTSLRKISSRWWIALFRAAVRVHLQPSRRGRSPPPVSSGRLSMKHGAVRAVCALLRPPRRVGGNGEESLINHDAHDSAGSN